MRSRKPANSLGLGRYSLLRCGHSTALMEQSSLLFLLWPLDELGWSTWPESFYSLVLRVTSSSRVYLIAMVNIASDTLGFFMTGLWIRDWSLRPFLKNMTIDLSSTSGIEGSEKVTRGGGVNGSESKFLTGTWPISQNQPNDPLF
jgi:hypothetical protein